MADLLPVAALAFQHHGHTADGTQRYELRLGNRYGVVSSRERQPGLSGSEAALGTDEWPRVTLGHGLEGSRIGIGEA